MSQEDPVKSPQTHDPVGNAIPPVEHTGIHTTEPPTAAAGLSAVLSTLKHIRSEMGLFKGLALLNRVNQHQGFDCPGCAWPDPDTGRSSIAEYCENGAKAIAEEGTERLIGAGFFQQYSIRELARWSDHELGKSGRLSEPMILREGEEHYQPVSWEDAFALIARQLQALDSPDEAIFYTSGRTSNEAAFLYQLFVRQYGTNNLPDCSNMCHESSGKALTETLGIGKGSVTLHDFELADLIIVIGQNPGTNHPRMLTALQKAKKNGGKIISINPLPEVGLRSFKHPQQLSGLFGSGTALADMHLPVRINGDVAVLKGIMKIMLDKEDEQPGMVFDHAFIEQKTTGYRAFADDLRKVNLLRCEESGGISLDKLREAADMIMASKKIICCWAMGLTQHKNAVGNIQELVNLLLLKGSIGIPGGGTCPVRGHSNVQGDRTMGIWEIPQPEFMERLEKEFDFQPPLKNGYNTVAAIQAMHRGAAKVFIGLGGNFLSATPDTLYTAKALGNCLLTVQVSTKLNRSHLVTGQTALILPCLGRSETDRQAGGAQFVSVENSMGVVHRSEGHQQPASSQLMSEPAIVAHMAQHSLPHSSTNWLEMAGNYDLIRDRIQATIPGFEDYNKRIRKEGGFYLPNSARIQQFNTTDGLAKFTIHPIPVHQLKTGEFMMMTIRSHDQFNTTIYGLDDRYRGIYRERRVVLMNEEDMEKEGLKPRDAVDIRSDYDGETRIAKGFLVVPYVIPRHCVATYFPEANVLVPIGLVADKSHTPASKSIVVTLHKG